MAVFEVDEDPLFQLKDDEHDSKLKVVTVTMRTMGKILNRDRNRDVKVK